MVNDYKARIDSAYKTLEKEIKTISKQIMAEYSPTKVGEYFSTEDDGIVKVTKIVVGGLEYNYDGNPYFVISGTIVNKKGVTDAKDTQKIIIVPLDDEF